MIYSRYLRIAIKNAKSYSTAAQTATQKSPKNAQKSSTKRIKGMSDYLGEGMSKLNLIESEAKKVMQLYGYNKIVTPILEPVELFNKGLGEGSEVVVGKELYELEDVKNGERLALRPEGTAGVVRAFINHDLKYQLPQKFYYFGPMFRRERPQKGRLRQFHQFGAECIGISSTFNDVELISQGYMLLKNLGLQDRVVLKINSIGDFKSRQNYVQALKSYLNPYKDQLSEFSKLKLDINPIKILDSKFSNDLKLISNGPQLLDYLNTSSSSHFEELQKELKIQGIPFEVDNNLVRGLDYYNDTVWEFVSKPGEKSLGESQCTVLGGGRYQGLIEKLEGKFDQSNEIPSIGWACGAERLSLMLNTIPHSAQTIRIIPMIHDTTAQYKDTIITSSHRLAAKLRNQNLASEVNFPTKNSAKFLAQLNSKFVVFIGEEEVKAGQFTVKNWTTREQFKVGEDGLVELLKDQRA